MTTYEISLLLLHDPEDAGARPIRVSANYITNEPALSAEHKAAILALPPNGVWLGRALQIKRLDTSGPA